MLMVANISIPSLDANVDSLSKYERLFTEEIEWFQSFEVRTVLYPKENNGTWSIRAWKECFDNKYIVRNINFNEHI